jgi:hypothetical protein
VIPVIVHPSHTIEGTGTPPDGTRVVTTASLAKLRSAVKDYARAIAHDNQFRSPAAVNDQLEYLKLDAAEIITAYTVAARREPKKP